jgi:hypothetical protein
VYPAASSGRVTLNSLRGGTKGSVTVNAVSGSEPLPNGASATYSTYSFTASPSETTQYWFSSGQGVSPRSTVTVAP